LFHESVREIEKWTKKMSKIQKAKGFPETGISKKAF